MMMSSSHVGSFHWTDRLPVIRALTLPFVVSLIIALLLLLSSVAGLLFGQRGLYEPNPATLPSFLAQDVITLFVAVPLLVVSVWIARNGSLRGLLLWTGTLFYIAYAYSYFVLGTWLAPLFLVYAAIVSMSLCSFIYVLLSIDADAVKARFASNTPVRWAGGFVMFIAVLLGTMEVVGIVGDIVSGTEPTRTLFVVWPLDLVIAFPALFWGGLWLWRRQPLGYVVGAVVLLKAAAEGLSLVVQTGATILMSGIGDALLPAYAVTGVGGLVLLTLYFRGVISPSRVRASMRSGGEVAAHA
jgi:hypothetical protein